MILYLIAAIFVTTGTALNPMDDYVSKEDPHYKWEFLEHHTVHTVFGGTAYALNVTSQKWLDESILEGPNGAIWTHQVIVVVPRNLKYTNVSYNFMTDGGNDSPNQKLKPFEDYNIIVVDELAHNSQMVTIAIKQMPNGPFVYKSDPLQKRRNENSLLSYSIMDYIQDPKANPERLIWLAMAKAGFNCMRAAQEFLKERNIADIQGWIVSGASKRGWTTYNMAATKCETCPAKIIAIAPLIPIIPSFRQDVHRQFRSYGAFSFAFVDMTDLNYTLFLDDERNIKAMDIIDVDLYEDRLAKIPKLVMVSSSDEYMSMDWTQLYWDQMQGEKHL